MTDIGYKKPPKHSQFSKGCSGNPEGRPKGSKNTLKLLNDVLEQKIPITQDGKTINITKKLAVLLQLVNSAVKGNLKATAALMPYLLQLDEEKEQVAQSLAQDDVEIINLFLENNKENENA